MEKRINFPAGFVWGTATSAYQIEGAWNKDGKGPSIWDDFSHTPGNIEDGSTGDLACDHYHRYREDIGLMTAMNCNAYRFSISWPRVIPEGRGQINGKGADFYDRLIDSLLEKNITPFVTLHHWDLPSALQKRGGWTHRKTARYFAEYAEQMARLYGDRVRYWITLNEPISIAGSGYGGGVHAPGRKSPVRMFQAVHFLLLGHGLAVQAMRSSARNINIGITNAFAPVYPQRVQDERIVARISAFLNEMFMDPIFKGRYPKEIAWIIKLLNRKIRHRDFKTIAEPIDFIGVNHYSRLIARRTFLPYIGFKVLKPVYENVVFTDIDWEVYPPGFYRVLKWIHKTYDAPVIYVTENGAAFQGFFEGGRIDDSKRIDYLESYLAYLHRALAEGVDIRGYFVWSLLDNFEWQYGYTTRFGLVYVDYETQKRIIKESGHWYADVCRTGGFTPSDHLHRHLRADY